MLRQPAASFEREEQEPEVPAVDQTGLPMPVLRWVWLGLLGSGKIRKVQRHYGPG